MKLLGSWLTRKSCRLLIPSVLMKTYDIWNIVLHSNLRQISTQKFFLPWVAYHYFALTSWHWKLQLYTKIIQHRTSRIQHYTFILFWINNNHSGVNFTLAADLIVPNEIDFRKILEAIFGDLHIGFLRIVWKEKGSNLVCFSLYFCDY